MDQTPELPPHLRKSIPEEDDSDDYCPQLPLHLQAKKQHCPVSPNSISKSSEDLNCINDTQKDYCPELPPHLQKSTQKSSSQSDNEEDSFCPELPPHLSNKKESRVYGAPLPPSDYRGSPKNTLEEEEESDIGYGPMPAPTPVNIDEHFEKVFRERNERMSQQLKDKASTYLLPLEYGYLVEIRYKPPPQKKKHVCYYI